MSEMHSYIVCMYGVYSQSCEWILIKRSRIISHDTVACKLTKVLSLRSSLECNGHLLQFAYLAHLLGRDILAAYAYYYLCFLIYCDLNNVAF